MDITFLYALKRNQMGRQPQFCQQGPEMCDNLLHSMQEAKRYILRNPVHQETQNTPSMSKHKVNTTRAAYTNTGCNHSEGGWPRDVNINDPESTQRYRRKMEKEDGYLHSVMSLTPGLEHYVHQNNAIDMYQTYYSELSQLPKKEHSDCRTVNVFRDAAERGPKRPVSSMCWQPEGGQRLAVSYLNVDFNRDTQASVDAYIWDVENANSPETTIVPPCPMLDLQYNPKDARVLAGALLSGQVAAWDRRSPRRAALLCAPHAAHRGLVRSVLFVSAKSGLEFFSSGPDGAVKWWDMRNMDEPVDELILDVIKSTNEQQSMARSYGAIVLEFESTLPTRFMVGTENGLVITGNRKGKTPIEKLPGRFDAHDGPVWALERNPGFLKNFMTVGDWTARIWSEDCRDSSIIWFSLMLLTQTNGSLAVWDLLRRQYEPILSMQICEEPLLRVRTHEAGALVSCGSSKGSVFLLELSQNLLLFDKLDKGCLTATLERESKRERILEARMREIRLKQRQAEEGSPAASMTELDPTLGDKDLHEATADFFAILKKEQAALY